MQPANSVEPPCWNVRLPPVAPWPIGPRAAKGQAANVLKERLFPHPILSLRSGEFAAPMK